jgi:3-oxoadipate enol-lactonase
MDQPVKLHYEEQGSGIPLVLVHGFPLNRTIWEPVASMLKKHFRVVTPDLRGHGLSPVTAGAYSMRLLAADIAGLLDDLKLERVFLAGHSMGGYASLAFARAYPQRLAGLVLVASQPFADTPERRQGRMVQAGQVEKDGTRVAVDSMAQRLTNRPEFYEPLHRLMLQTDARGVIGALLGMAERPDMTGFLETLNLPVLMLAGDQDAIIPYAQIQAFSTRLQHGRLVTLHGGAHMPMLEEPEKTAEALKSWILSQRR